MKKLSKKAERFRKKISPVRQIMNHADPEYIKKQGVNPEELISMAGGWVNHESPELLRKAYEHIILNPKLFHISGKYSHTLGDIEFKKAICKFEKELYGMNISEKQIAVGTSSTELASILFTVLLDPEDKILLLDPSYCNYPTQILTDLPNVEILRFSVVDEKRWEYIADEKSKEFAEFIIENKPKVVLLVSPDNPTSKVLSSKFVEITKEAVKKVGGFLLIDFAYKELIFDENYPSYFSWAADEEFIAIRSNSKWSRSLGRRLGWVEAPEFVIEAMESIQSSRALCPDTLHQMALTKYINDSILDNSLVDYVRNTRKLYKDVAEKTTKILEENLNFKIMKPDGGLYVWMKVEEDGTEFVQNVLRETGVLFVPGWGFGRSGRKAIRLSFGPLVNDIDLIEKGIKLIQEYKKKMDKNKKIGVIE